MGLNKRRLYKPERKAARTKGALGKGALGKNAPLSCLDANTYEVASALYAICEEAGVVVGRAAGYDALRDEYTVTGKSKATGKAQEFVVQGEVVGALIGFGRQVHGGKFEKQGLTKRIAARGAALR